MIKYVLDSSGELKITIDKSLIERKNELYSTFNVFISKMASAGILNVKSSQVDLLCREPIVSLLFNSINNQIDRYDTNILITYINELLENNLLNQNDSISIRQNSIYLPIDTSGNTNFMPVDLEFNEIHYLSQQYGIMKNKLGMQWCEFVNPVSVITIVSVPGYEDLPYFSGSGSEIWGAIHLAKPSSQPAYCEMITHEAAHHWCHLVEDLGNLSEHCWSGDNWPSPWRNEPRPLGGVIHGVFVFATAAVTLSRLKILFEREVDNISLNINQRIAYLIAQVETGIRICNNTGLILQNGQVLINSAKSGIESIYPHIQNESILKARDLLAKRMQVKYDIWRSKGIAFNAI